LFENSLHHMKNIFKLISFFCLFLISFNAIATEDINNKYIEYTSSTQFKRSYTAKQLDLINSQEFKNPIIKRITDLTKDIQNNNLILDHLIKEHVRSRHQQILAENIVNSQFSEQVLLMDATILVVDEFGCSSNLLDNKLKDRYQSFYEKLNPNDKLKMDLFNNKFEMISTQIKLNNYSTSEVEKTNSLVRNYLAKNNFQLKDILNPCITPKIMKGIATELDTKSAEISFDQYFRVSLFSISYNLSVVDEKYNRQAPNIYCPKNEYPSVAKANNMEGSAIINFQVSKNGEVLKNEITNTTKHKVLDDYLLENTKKCLFVPNYTKGIASNSEFKMRFTFKLED
jgi:TonB family protein